MNKGLKIGVPVFTGLLAALVGLTTCEKVDPVPLLLVSTDSIADISIDRITVTGTIVHLGERVLEQHGFCWTESGDPTVDLQTKTELGSKSEAGPFSGSIAGLSANTTYSIRAYGTDRGGTIYGVRKSFTTRPRTAPIVRTIAVTAITLESALGGGEISFDGGADIKAKGVCWSTGSYPTLLNSYTDEGGGTDDYVSILNRLTCATTYYVRAYATNDLGTGYGEQVAFSTLDCPVGLPVVVTHSTTVITETHAEAGGEISDEGSSVVTARGICWSTSRNPVLSDSHSFNGGGGGSYTSTMSELSCGTKYFFRAYATNEAGTAYGQLDSFQTAACPVFIPTVNTEAVTEISQTAARGGGEVVDNGGSNVTVKGICWSTSAMPTLNDNYTINGSGTGSFVSQMTGLQCGTTYYVRAYATNGAGTGYGPSLEFRTDDCVYMNPTVNTLAPTDVTQTSFQAGGNVTADGGAAILAKGICWSTHQLPTLLDEYTDEGPGTGEYTSFIDGLECGTNYYIRAYATNTAGTAYGAQIAVTTNLCLTPPTVHTSGVTEVTDKSALAGGEVTDDGNLEVTSRGICWSSSPGPTVLDSKSENGMGIGSFSHLITGLAPKTTYYFRAYAINSEGTSYGTEINFTTWEGSVTDYDGNRYPTVRIGNQTWMAANLKVSHFPDGSAIPHVPGYDEWKALDYNDKAYCWYRSEVENLEIYGALYNWAAAANGSAGSDANPSGIQGVCPDGWHLPSSSEWSELEIELGMSPDEAFYPGFDRGTNEGGMLKETGTSHWIEPNAGATNESGFNGLPAGAREGDGYYYSINVGAYFWTVQSQGESEVASFRFLSHDYGGIEWNSQYKKYGYSVRCVKDE